MDSSKVIVGSPTLASEYNKLRKDAIAAQYYPINTVDNDDTFLVSNEIVADYSTVLFGGGAKSSCYFDLMLNTGIDTAENLLIAIAFDMHSAQVGKNVYLELEYSVVDEAGDTTAAVTNLKEVVSVPDTANTLKSLTLSTLFIPLASLTAGSTISMKLSRLGSNVLDTHTGDFRLFELQLYQLQN